ncbi:MAG: flagellar basal body rod protein FlgB [Pseudomonadota bacterium]
MDHQGLFSQTITLLEKVLDFRSQRHSLIVSNIANMDTPRYQGVDLIFEDELREALQQGEASGARTSHKRHFPVAEKSLQFVQPRIVPSAGLILSNDLNTVDVEKEMTKLAENNLMYNAAAQILRKKFEGMKTAIRGGGR